MKTCPQCHQVYPDETTFCFVDGTTLESNADPRVGSTLVGRYALDGVIGSGTMATVYRAHHRLLDRPFATRVLHLAAIREPIVRDAFRWEVGRLKRLAHPNLIEIFDDGDTEDGAPFLVTELLEGESLSKRLAPPGVGKVKLPLAIALSIAVQTGRALARGHDFGAVHADLRPDTVFLIKPPYKGAPEAVKLLDFGVARLAHARATNASPTAAEYRAPEQASTGNVYPLANVYTMGCILYEMLTGAQPSAESPAPLTDVLPRDVRGTQVPAALSELVASMMARTPRDRPIDAPSFISRLEQIAESISIPLPSDPDIDDGSALQSPPKSPPLKNEGRTGAERDAWIKRISIFDRMMKQAFGANPPADAVKNLEKMRGYISEVQELRKTAASEQEKLEIIDSEGLADRVRFGRSMGSVTKDASKLREEARAAARLGPEGEKKAGMLARELGDMGYQIEELWQGLDSIEQGLAERRAESLSAIAELGRKADEIEGELLYVASRFCAPLRSRPDLGVLFRDLELAGAARA